MWVQVFMYQDNVSFPKYFFGYLRDAMFKDKVGLLFYSILTLSVSFQLSSESEGDELTVSLSLTSTLLNFCLEIGMAVPVLVIFFLLVYQVKFCFHVTHWGLM